MMVPEWKRKIKVMEEDKQKRQDKAKLHEKAAHIFAETLGGTGNLVIAKLDQLLKWHDVNLKELKGKNEKVAKWKQILERKKPPPSFNVWAEADEAKLLELREFKIEIEDTALGRQQQTTRRELLASIPSMSREELEELKKEVSSFEVPAAESTTQLEEEATPEMPPLPDPVVRFEADSPADEEEQITDGVEALM